ncbi:ribonuclease HIII [Candidatus Mycoplasma haematolamae str. Purdue]|uniref:Ribonuclease n=1 Tax=Mycoplasma haematolamae (strain Purdue) TaxID=1212765 RepID=I7CK13_MYCHA|nr:ribonuclease HIII [Candidatus Mycoplasma haematolamae str. Purdue]
MLNDSTVYFLAPKLKELLSEKIFYLSLGAREYNSMYSGLRNINLMLSKLHNELWTQLSSYLEARGGGIPRKSVIDQFCTREKYYEHLRKIGIKGQWVSLFLPKAEGQFLSCAISSIISRYHFLEEMNELSKRLGLNLPLGASSLVIESYNKISSEGKYLDSEYCKTHFKTLQKAKSL